MAFSRDQLFAMLDGIRMPLTREGRFLRSYDNREAKRGTVVSRFMDGTAEISLSELKESWPRWSRFERYE